MQNRCIFKYEFNSITGLEKALKIGLSQSNVRHILISSGSSKIEDLPKITEMYTYFAKKYSRVKEAMYFTFICGFSLMLLTCIILFIFAEKLMGGFVSGSPDVIAIGMGAFAGMTSLSKLTVPFIGGGASGMLAAIAAAIRFNPVMFPPPFKEIKMQFLLFYFHFFRYI